MIEPIRIPILETSVQQLNNPKVRVVLLSEKDAGERLENFMQVVLTDIKEVLEKTQVTATVEKSRPSEPQETEDSIEASRVGSYAAGVCN